MTRVVEIGNSNNWENIYNYSVTAAIDNDFPIPLPAVTLPIFLESDIVALYVNTQVPEGNYGNGGVGLSRYLMG